MMPEASRVVLVIVTAPDRQTAEALAQQLLEQRLAACVNIVPGLRSHYWWQNQIESAEEVLMLVKARRQDLATLTELVRSSHPYDVPEVIALEIVGGLSAYLDWVEAETERD